MNPELFTLVADVRHRLAALGLGWQDLAAQFKPESPRARQRREAKAKVYAEALRLAMACPALPINRDFFERVSEAPGICRSGATCETLYYEATTRDGLPSALQTRINP